MRIGLVIWIGLVLLVSCKSKSRTMAHRAECEQIADHIADIIIDDYTTHPDRLWDAVHAEPGDPGLPPDTTKESFKAFLDSPEGQSWIAKRRAGAREGTYAAVKQCMAKATPAQIKCLLAAKTREEVQACDTVK